MTIIDLCKKINDEKPNTFKGTKILSFINEIEKEVAEQMAEEFEQYEAVDDTELLAPDPYSRLYISYVKARIDYTDEEFDAYENDIAQHNQEFKDFVDWVVREGVAVNNIAPTRFKNLF